MNNSKFFKYYTNTNNIIAVIPFNADGFFETVSIGTDVNLNDGLEVSFQGMSTKIKIRIIRLHSNLLNYSYDYIAYFIICLFRTSI